MRNRNGQDTVCVVCSSQVSEKVEIMPAIANDSEHVQLLQKALITIFERLDQFDFKEAEIVALDSLSVFQALSGGKVSS